jgi:uncharacterized membrane protein
MTGKIRMKNKTSLAVRSIGVLFFGFTIFLPAVYLIVIITALIHYGRVDFDVLRSGIILEAALKQAILMSSISTILYIIFQCDRARRR